MSTARDALRAPWRLVRRHKIASVITAACLAALVVIGIVVGSAGGATQHTDPPAPAFNLAALGHTGQRVSLSEYAGKPLIVNFWASWCEPCQQETPLLARFYHAQGGRVTIVGLDENDSTGSALKFALGKGVTYPLGFDPQLAAANAYGVVALPQTFFLNARHQIVDRIFGAVTMGDLAKGTRLMGQSRG